jgi:hypothetical protein
MAEEERKEDEADSTQEEIPLCPNCLEPVEPRSYYCPNCGSTDAVNPLTTYMPWESIRFEYGGYGKLWRIMMRRSKSAWKTVLLTLVLIVAAPVAIPLFVASAIIYGKSSTEQFRSKAFWTVVAVGVIIAGICVCFWLMGARPAYIPPRAR